jgi:hypothetical protein
MGEKGRLMCELHSTCDTPYCQTKPANACFRDTLNGVRRSRERHRYEDFQNLLGTLCYSGIIALHLLPFLKLPPSQETYTRIIAPLCFVLFGLGYKFLLPLHQYAYHSNCMPTMVTKRNHIPISLLGYVVFGGNISY